MVARRERQERIMYMSPNGMICLEHEERAALDEWERTLQGILDEDEDDNGTEWMEKAHRESARRAS
jgi:hypothetical protein